MLGRDSSGSNAEKPTASRAEKAGSKSGGANSTKRRLQTTTFEACRTACCRLASWLSVACFRSRVKLYSLQRPFTLPRSVPMHADRQRGQRIDPPGGAGVEKSRQRLQWLEHTGATRKTANVVPIDYLRQQNPGGDGQLRPLHPPIYPFYEHAGCPARLMRRRAYKEPSLWPPLYWRVFFRFKRAGVSADKGSCPVIVGHSDNLGVSRSDACTTPRGHHRAAQTQGIIRGHVVIIVVAMGQLAVPMRVAIMVL